MAKYLSKKMIKKIDNAIDDFFMKELDEIIEYEYPPDTWTEEDKKRFDAFSSSSYALKNKIEKILTEA